MEPQRTIENQGYTIRLTLDNDSTRLKQLLSDLCDATGLQHLKEHDQINRLLDLLLSGKYKEALKTTS